MSLAKRWSKIDLWCRRHGIDDIYLFFSATRPAIADHHLRIRAVVRGGVVSDVDSDWLTTMEGVIAKI
jgi:hypothetical protein